MFTYRSRFLKNSLRSNRVYSGLNQIFSYSSSRLARDSCSTIFLYSSQYFSLYSFILSISFKTHGPYAKYSVLFGSEAYKSSLIYNPNRIGGNAVSISFLSFVSTLSIYSAMQTLANIPDQLQRKIDIPFLPTRLPTASSLGMTTYADVC